MTTTNKEFHAKNGIRVGALLGTLSIDATNNFTGVNGTLTGNLAVTGNVSVNTNKFTVAAATGNTVIAGSITATGVNASTTIAPTGTGVITLTSAVAGTINNMSVGATTRGSGAFTTLASNGATTFTAGTTSTTTTTGTLVVTGGTGISENLNVGGYVKVAGTGDVTGNFNVNTNKFSVIAASGNTSVAGTFSATGNATLSADLAVNGTNVTTTQTTGTVAVFNTSLTGTLNIGGLANVNIGGAAKTITSSGNFVVAASKTSTLNGIVYATSGTASTTTATGALVVTGGVGISGTLYANAQVIKDANLSVIGTADATKVLKFDSSGISAATTRTLTAPDASGIITLTTATQTLTNKTIDAAVGGNVLKVNGNLITATAGTGTVTIPNVTDTLVGKATTDVLTNKTYDTAGVGNVFKVNGNTVSAYTGSTNVVVLATSPTLITPVLGVATATSINKVAITQPATGSTLTLVEGSTLATSGAYSITLTSVGTTNVTLPTSGVLAVKNQTMYIGTTAVTIDRASAPILFTGVNGFTGDVGTTNVAIRTSNVTSIASGAIFVETGTTTTSGTTGNINIASGASVATSGNITLQSGSGTTSGNITIDAGAGSVTDGAINIGLTNALTVNLPSGRTKIGTATFTQGSASALSFTLPTVGGSLVGTGDSATVTNTMLSGGIANSKLTNSTISGVALGSSLFGLSAGTGLSWAAGTSYDGSVARTLNISTVPVANGGTGLTSAGSNGYVLGSNGSAIEYKQIIGSAGVDITIGTGTITIGLTGGVGGELPATAYVESAFKSGQYLLVGSLNSGTGLGAIHNNINTINAVDIRPGNATTITNLIAAYSEKSGTTKVFGVTLAGAVTGGTYNGLTLNTTDVSGMTNVKVSSGGSVQFNAVSTLTASSVLHNVVTATVGDLATSLTLGATTGTTTVRNALTVTAGKTFTSNLVAITGGAISGTTVSGSTGSFTTLAASGATTVTAATASTNSATGALVVTGGVGIGGNLNVAGTLSAGTIVATAGTGYDQIYTFSTSSIALSTSWAPTGLSGATLATGSYMVQLMNAAGTDIYTGFMSWSSVNGVDTNTDEIILHRAGSIASGMTTETFLRYVRASAGAPTLQISSSGAVAAQVYTLKFRRMM